METYSQAASIRGSSCVHRLLLNRTTRPRKNSITNQSAAWHVRGDAIVVKNVRPEAAANLFSVAFLVFIIMIFFRYLL
jgi:hypothetical protein